MMDVKLMVKVVYASQLIVAVSSVFTRTCHSRLGSYNPQVHNLFSCAWCYEYLFSVTSTKQLFASNKVPFLYNPSKKLLISPDVENHTVVREVCSTLDDDECQRWQACCSAAHVCCTEQLSTSLGDINNTCSRTWDGWECWEDTRPGDKVYRSCPLYLKYSMPTRSAVKTCLSNASWERRDGMEWTNYQPCLSFEDLKTSIFLGLGCSVASIIALFPAIILFIKYQYSIRIDFTLCSILLLFMCGLRKQHRIRLHINFFLSLLLKEITVVLWDVIVTYERISNSDASDTVLAQNGVGCKVLSFMKIYFKGASFTWMFCEGFFLHRLMSDAFSPPRSLLSLYITGWAVPFTTTVIYSILRTVYANESCWSISYNHFEWIFDVPNLACLVVNLIFLCNILRILLTQMQSHPNEPSNFRKALKAMFVLIPLFGIQLFVTIYRVPTSSPGGLKYERFSIVVNNLQGFFVALIFCFLNNEVISHLRRTWRHRIRDRNVSHSKRQNSTSINMTLTSRVDNDFQSVHKPLCDKTDDNSGESLHKGEIHNSYERVPTSNKAL